MKSACSVQWHTEASGASKEADSSLAALLKLAPKSTQKGYSAGEHTICTAAAARYFVAVLTNHVWGPETTHLTMVAPDILDVCPARSGEATQQTLDLQMSQGQLLS